MLNDRRTLTLQLMIHARVHPWETLDTLSIFINIFGVGSGRAARGGGMIMVVIVVVTSYYAL